MTYTIRIDQEFALMHDLTLTQVSTLAAFMTLPVWTKTITIDGVVWYMYSETKMAEDFPLLFGVAKRCYKNISELAARGFVKLLKIGKNKYVTFTEKCSDWGKEKLDRKRTASPKMDSEESENGPENSPKMDCITNNIINSTNNIINSEENILFPEEKNIQKKGTSEGLCLFRNSRFSAYEEFAKQFQKPEFEGVDIAYYYEAVKDWSDAGGKKKRDWIATARNFIRGDFDKGKLHKLPTATGLSESAEAYLKMGDFGI